MSTPAVSLVVHGHFYQPPRENPWTDEVAREPGAAPHHDWNQRIHAECYRANAFARVVDGGGRIGALVNGYTRLSFDFGPTLARWIERYDARTHRRLCEADAEQARRLGFGGSLAQAWAHPIVPLLSPGDRRTHLLWGLADFRRRFGRPAEGLWLPETAANPAALEALIDLGVRFTILAPEQVARVRPPGGGDWQTVDRDTVDTGRAYRFMHRDGSGRFVTVAVFDGPMSRAAAFGSATQHADAFADAVEAAAARSSAGGNARLVLCASDGELYGHHKKFADLTLTHATLLDLPARGIEVTNLAAFLDAEPAVWEMDLAAGPTGEGSAWSCPHGLGRWLRHCGCASGAAVDAGWSQAWRQPLRAGLDLVRDAAAAFYEDAAGEILSDPWGARDAYGEVVDAPLAERSAALRPFARGTLAGGGGSVSERLFGLLELQRATLLMYASCGWFFDDVDGLESRLVLRHAAHALDLFRQAGGAPPMDAFLEVLGEARSNRQRSGTGADVFRRVAGDRVTPAHAAARVAFEVLAHPAAAAAGAIDQEALGSWVTLSAPRIQRPRAAGVARLAGRVLIVERRTGRRSALEIDATYAGGEDFDCRLADGDPPRLGLRDLDGDSRRAILGAALPSFVARAGDPRACRTALAVALDAAATEGVNGFDATRVRRILGDVLIGLMRHPGSEPASSEALAVAGELLKAVGPAITDEQRSVLEELVWNQLVSHGYGSGIAKTARRIPPELATLAGRLGFAPPAEEPDDGEARDRS